MLSNLGKRQELCSALLCYKLSNLCPQWREVISWADKDHLLSLFPDCAFHAFSFVYIGICSLRVANSGQLVDLREGGKLYQLSGALFVSGLRPMLRVPLVDTLAATTGLDSGGRRVIYLGRPTLLPG